MKKWLLLLFLILPCSVNATVLGDSGTGTSTDICDAGLLFSWHCESTTVDQASLESPVGCSKGDTTGAANATPALSTLVFTDGDESCLANSANDWYQFDFTAWELASVSIGRFEFDIYITTFLDEARPIRVRGADGNHDIAVVIDGTDDATGREIKIKYNHLGVTENVAVTTDADMAVATWYHVVAKYDTDGVNPDLWIQTTNKATGVSSAAVVNNADNTVLDGASSYLCVGESNNKASVYYLDNIKIYNTW